MPFAEDNDASEWEPKDLEEIEATEIRGTAEEELSTLMRNVHGGDISIPERVEFLSLLDGRALEDCHATFGSLHDSEFKDLARLFFEFGSRAPSLRWLLDEIGSPGGKQWFREAHRLLQQKERQFDWQHAAEVERRRLLRESAGPLASAGQSPTDLKMSPATAPHSPLEECSLCGAGVRKDHMQRHIEQRCPKRAIAPPSQNAMKAAPVPPPEVVNAPRPQVEKEMAPFSVPIERIPFELLPPGSWDVEHVVAYYERLANQSDGISWERKIEWQRLEAMKKLNPEQCSIGKEGWTGYVVFEFLYSKRVVLECPVEGNATYVLSGDWRKMVGHSKLYLRTNYPERCTRIVHKGDEWLDRVRAALWV